MKVYHKGEKRPYFIYAWRHFINHLDCAILKYSSCIYRHMVNCHFYWNKKYLLHPRLKCRVHNSNEIFYVLNVICCSIYICNLKLRSYNCSYLLNNYTQMTQANYQNAIRGRFKSKYIVKPYLLLNNES